MNKITLKSFVALIALSIVAFGCRKTPDPVEPDPSPTTNEFHFMFENYFGNDMVKLDGTTFTTAQNEDITISTINYWITNIEFVKADGSTYKEPESYRLVRGDQAATRHFHVKDVPAGTYTGVKYIIGVDVARNTGGAQTGALDPAINGDMYWSWSTGYIQAKLEGLSPASTQANNAFMFHIGGVAAGTESPRNISLTFAAPIVVGEKAGTATIKADVAKWFAPNALNIAQTPMIMSPGTKAAEIADNYAQMFSITSSGNEAQ